LILELKLNFDLRAESGSKIQGQRSKISVLRCRPGSADDSEDLVFAHDDEFLTIELDL
jgi:hypothetical protein